MTGSIPRILCPAAPALVVRPQGAVWLSEDGEIETLSLAQAGRRLIAQPAFLCHRRQVAARLGLAIEAVSAYDLLDLFAFVRPAAFLVPTVRGLAEALGLSAPAGHEDEAALLPDLARALLGHLAGTAASAGPASRLQAGGVAGLMAAAGWPWGPAVLAALGLSSEEAAAARGAVKVWERLPEWIEQAPEPPPGHLGVDPGEARRRLAEMLPAGAEQRPAQADYASAASLAFRPRSEPGAPNLVLAEAGTGTGKTLGYIAPASLWAEKNKGPVWISTFTRTLQRQLDGELSRLHPDARIKARKVVIRKGRENYLCLLNLEEAVQLSRPSGPEAVLLGLVLRWAEVSRDGDMIGGDLPGWLFELHGPGRLQSLADRRGECIHSACPHYRRCVIERTLRRARSADIVVANHALVMIQAALGGLDNTQPPTHYVFDEGHHLFDAADSAFAAVLSGLETAELRRWLLGAEAGGRRSRARGLKRRVEDLLGGQPEGMAALEAALGEARGLPGPGWHQRLAGEAPPPAAAEAFLFHLRREVLAKAAGPTDGPYGLECEARPGGEALIEAAARLAAQLMRLRRPLAILSKALARLLDEEADSLDSATRQRIEAVTKGIDRRAERPLAAWCAMLDGLVGQPPEDFVEWLSIERIEGREVDVAFHRHWIDPTRPFAGLVVQPAQGVLVTSATLKDGTGDAETDWQAALQRTGALHLPLPAVRAVLPSPFDYASRTRVLIVNDVRKDDMAQVAAAYRSLFLAAGGGGLGLFTAVSRLKEVWRRIAGPLDEAGIGLLAQHVDGMDTATLVEIFRAEENACLLGTDAVRDGVDVPGRSLRLIVFDRVPWPRPDILHKARRALFGGRAYDDRIARLRLKQAFGRLVRRSDDAGVFVLLDPLMPSRLHGAFPPGLVPRKVGLAEAVSEVAAFLGG